MKPDSNNAPFWRGDLVRCVDASERYPPFVLREGGVYVVTECDFWDDDWGVFLADIPNEGPEWEGFSADRFRLLMRPIDLPAETHEREREPA